MRRSAPSPRRSVPQCNVVLPSLNYLTHGRQIEAWGRAAKDGETRLEAISATVPTHRWHSATTVLLCVLLLAARGQLHYETNDFIYLASQSVSQMIPTFDAISHFLGREVKHFDFLCCLHARKPTLFSNVRDPHSPFPNTLPTAPSPEAVPAVWAG